MQHCKAGKKQCEESVENGNGYKFSSIHYILCYTIARITGDGEESTVR